MENVNSIINDICEKLGTTVEYVIPEYAKMKIASSCGSIIVLLVVVAVYLILLQRCKRFYENYDRHTSSLYQDGLKDFAGFAAFIVGILLSIITALVLSVEIPVLFKFLASPTGAFVEDVLSSVK